jgi:hypothetical protein
LHPAQHRDGREAVAIFETERCISELPDPARRHNRREAIAASTPNREVFQLPFFSLVRVSREAPAPLSES